jgi:hypothetical protein
MSGEKRPPPNSFGSAQLVKRAKSDADMGASSAVSVVNRDGQSGALIRAVCLSLDLHYGKSMYKTDYAGRVRRRGPSRRLLWN